MNVLIADDHAVVRQGLRWIVSHISGAEQIGEAADGDQALAMLRSGRWDLLLLDLNMPVRGGLEVLSEVRRVCPHLKVIVLSMYAEDQVAVRLLRQGASAYLTKERAVDELTAAITRVMAGGRYLSPALADLATRAFQAGPAGGLPSLSPREYQVLQLLARGQAIKEIAQHLSLSVKTVSTFRTRVLRKLGLHNNAELIAYALANGVIV